MSFIAGITGMQHKGWQQTQPQTVRPATKRIHGVDNIAANEEPKT
jgi:uncharacterized protein VirK/YbjX